MLIRIFRAKVGANASPDWDNMDHLLGPLSGKVYKVKVVFTIALDILMEVRM